jgi:hypothetical protein
MLWQAGERRNVVIGHYGFAEFPKWDWKSALSQDG